MAVKLQNDVQSFLAVTASSDDATVRVTAGDGSKFPSLVSGEYFYITVQTTAGTTEVMRVTSRSGDVLGVMRGQEGTAAAYLPAGSLVEARVTAQSVYDAASDASQLVVAATADALTELVYDRISNDIAAETTSKEYSFDGTGVQTVFDFGEAPGPADRLLVYVDGAYAPTDTWTVAGTTIVFDTAPALGTGNVRVVALALAVRNGHVVRSQITSPGDVPEAFTDALTGGPLAAPTINSYAVTTSNGRVMRMIGAQVVATAERAHLLMAGQGELFVRWLYARSTDAIGSPDNEIEIGLYWLDAYFKSIAGSEQIIETSTANVAAGLQETTAIIVDSPAPGKIVPPANAVYVVPFVRTKRNTGAVDVLGLEWAYPVEVARRSYIADFADLAQRALEVDAEDVIVAPSFQWPQSSIPEFPIGRTFYVAMNGDDRNSGTSSSHPLRTINAALTKMAAAAPDQCVTLVHPGGYLVRPNTLIPANCAMYGYDLRVTKLILSNASGTAAAVGAERQNNMFRMTNGIKLRGFTFTGLEHEPFTLAGGPPTKGWVFVFNPGETITRSPYISECSQLHDFTQAQMVLPIDRDNGNPLMPVGSGNILADGSVLDPDSPLRSVVVDSFTAINPNGVGYAITRNAFVQLVSVFTNWSRVGLWAHEGGQVTVANSNNTFGDYALVSTGFRNSIQIEGVANPAVLGVFTTSADAIETQTDAIVTRLMDDLYPTLVGWSGLTVGQRALAERDTRTLLRALVNDLRSGQDRASQYFTKGLFNWNGELVFSAGLVPLFVACWEQVEEEINFRLTDTGAENMVSALIAMISDVVSTPVNYQVPFASVIEATGQQFSNAGSGVNYNALPASQRGTGRNPDPTAAIYKSGGGKVYATFSTEVGDTYLGEDLRVDFERSTIEGQAFSRGVQNIALPLIVALGG